MVKDAVSQGPNQIDPIDLSIIRTLILSLYGFSVARYNNLSFTDQVKKEKVWYLVGRCVLGTMAYTSMVLSLQHIPLSLMSVLVNTTPFWTVILGYFISNDPVLWKQIVCMCGCFSGVLILTNGKKDGIDLEEEESKF